MGRIGQASINSVYHFMVRREEGGRLFELWAGLWDEHFMLCHPALGSHSLNILFFIFEKMNCMGCGKDRQALNIVFHFTGEEEEADCSNVGCFILAAV